MVDMVDPKLGEKILDKITHKLATQAGKSAIATAPTDGQAWRLTKEIFRPNLTDSQHHALGKLIESSEGSDQVGEIDLANGSKWTAKYVPLRISFTISCVRRLPSATRLIIG